MPAEIRWSRRSRDNLLAIYVFIGQHNESAAERVFDRIERRVAQLTTIPRSGPRRPDLGPTTRLLVEAPYLILYEVQPDEDEGDVLYVEIVDVVDGRRDL